MVKRTQDDSVAFHLGNAAKAIADTAAVFLTQGKLDIWIYLKDERLSYMRCEFKAMSPYLVAHFKTQQIVAGLARARWEKLGRDLARVYFLHHGNPTS